MDVPASLCASRARLVAVVSLSASSMMIGLTHSQPSAGVLILAQAEIKLIIIKSIQMGFNFLEPFEALTFRFEGRTSSFLGPSAAQPPVTVKPRQGTEQFADGCDSR